MYRTIVARLPDYALQRRTIPRIGTSMAAPPGVGSQRKSPRRRHIGRRAGSGPPRRIPHRSRSPPHTSHWIRLAYSAALKPAPLGPRNRKSAQIATFLRLRSVEELQIADRGPKTRQIDLFGGSFPACGDARASAIAKKLQKKADFCFCGVNCRNRSRFP